MLPFLVIRFLYIFIFMVMLLTRNASRHSCYVLLVIHADVCFVLVQKCTFLHFDLIIMGSLWCQSTLSWDVTLLRFCCAFKKIIFCVSTQLKFYIIYVWRPYSVIVERHICTLTGGVIRLADWCYFGPSSNKHHVHSRMHWQGDVIILIFPV